MRLFICMRNDYIMEHMRYVYACILVFVFVSGHVYAQFSVLPSPGMTRSSPFYFVERAFESIGTFFTFGREQKIERLIVLAEERLSEAVSLSYAQHSATGKTITDFSDVFDEISEGSARTDSPELDKKILESTAKHFAVFEEILDGVSEQARVPVEKAFEKDRAVQKQFLFKLAGTDSLAASELGFASIRERLAKLKIEVEFGRRYETAIITAHIKDIFDVLVAAALRDEAPSKALFAVLSNDITRTLESFDEISRSPKYPLGETGDTITDLKKRLVGFHLNLLEKMIPVDPPFVIEALGEVTRSRVAGLDRAPAQRDDVVLPLLLEYELYAVFADEVNVRTGRYVLNREENITVADALSRMLEKQSAQIISKQFLFSAEAQKEIDRILNR